MFLCGHTIWFVLSKCLEAEWLFVKCMFTCINISQPVFHGDQTILRSMNNVWGFQLLHTFQSSNFSFEVFGCPCLGLFSPCYRCGDCVTVALIWISPVTNGVERPFIYFPSIFKILCLLQGRICFKSFAYFSFVFFFLILQFCEFFTHCKDQSFEM